MKVAPTKNLDRARKPISHVSSISVLILLLSSCGDPQPTGQAAAQQGGAGATLGASDCTWSAEGSGTFNREVEGNVVWAGRQLGQQTGTIRLSQAQADRDSGDPRHNTALTIYLPGAFAVGEFEIAMGGEGGITLNAPEAINRPAQSGQVVLTEADPDKVAGNFTAIFSSPPHPTLQVSGSFSWKKGCPNK